MSEQSAGYYQTQVANLLKQKSDFFFLGIVALLLVGGVFYMTLSKQNAPAVSQGKIDNAYMAPKPTAAPQRTYIVKEGESLTFIAEQQLGNGDLWTDIVKLNNITDINTIVAGTKLLLPTGVVAMVPSATQMPSMTPAPSVTPAPAVSDAGDIGEGAMTKRANPNIKEYTVQEGEGLWQIAEKVYGDGEMFNEIMKANKIQNPDQIYVGMKLKMPHTK
jgi:nucleoid-associated protein YgaU